MPYIKVYIHFIWSTKMRQPFLETREIRQRVWKHILENAKKKGIFVDFVNGYSNHCHCLLSLCFDQSIQKLMQLIKGESSFWIHRDSKCMEILKGRKFEWQDEYYAISVSKSILNRIRIYIKNQERTTIINLTMMNSMNLLLNLGFRNFPPAKAGVNSLN